jgi:predicted ATPase
VLAASSRNGWRGRLQGPDAEKYYCHILGKFVAAIRASLMDHPLVLLLDDLQWADSRSLELLKILMTRSSSKPTASNLLILGTVRSETMNHSISFHQQQQQQQAEENDEESITLVKTIQELQEKGVAITNVDVPNICEDAVRELVGDLLPCSDVESLSRSVYSQTGGNIFFIFQLMKFWEGEGMLGNRNIHDDDPEKSVRRPLDCENASVVALIAKKIHQLPLNVQEVLKMAACFGTNLSIRLLEEAGSVGMSPLEVEPALAVAHELGLVEQDTSIGTVSFVHDAVREAAYSLIAENARASLHLFVGRALWVWLTHEELEQHIFLVTNHICRGLHLIDDPTEKEGLARLCLRSGQKAARVSAFSQASSYYETGISLLGKNHWKRNYWLSLDLYNSAAEAEYYAGNLSRVDMLLNGVFEHARNLDDKLHAYNTQLNSQSSREDVNQAFQVGLDVLTQMGVAFPSKLQTIRTQVALHACLQKLRGMSDDNIMSLPIMQDNRHIMVMRMLNTLMMSASLVRQSLVLPMMIRIVNRTLQYGICGSSTYRRGCLHALRQRINTYRSP